MASIAARFYSAVLLLVLAVVAEAGSQDDHSDLQKRAATTLASLETVVEGLSAKVQSLQADLTTINNELQDKLIHQSQKSHELEARVNSLVNAAAQTPAVSFFAKYTPDLLAHALNASAALVVNTVVSNEGQAYDSHRGVFTAPFSGTYAFFLSDAASINHATVMQLDLMVDQGDDEILCSARTISLHGGIPVSGSCQAVVRLQAGQTVWPRNLWDDARYWGGLTTFSGFLLHLN